MLRESGYGRPGARALTGGAGRPVPSPAGAVQVAYGLEGSVLAADLVRGEVLVAVDGGLRAEAFVGRCVRARLAHGGEPLSDRGGPCALTLADLHVGDRVEVRARLARDLGPRPPSGVDARQVVLLDPRCARRAA